MLEENLKRQKVAQMQTAGNTKNIEEIQSVLNLLMGLFANETDKFTFSSNEVAEINEERKFIHRNGYKLSHKVNDLNIGKGDPPLLRQNTREGESKGVYLGTDFVFTLPNAPKIFLEVTQCVDPVQKEIHRNPQYKPELRIFGYSLPAASEPNLTKKQKKADIKRQICEGKNLCNGGYYSDRPEEWWAEIIVNKNIKGKIDKYKQRPTEKLVEGEQLWLLIKTDYWYSWHTPFLDYSYKEHELLPHLLQQVKKAGLADFAPFNRLIITNAHGFLVFDKDWSHYQIWLAESLGR